MEWLVSLAAGSGETAEHVDVDDGQRYAVGDLALAVHRPAAGTVWCRFGQRGLLAGSSMRRSFRRIGLGD